MSNEEANHWRMKYGRYVDKWNETNAQLEHARKTLTRYRTTLMAIAHYLNERREMIEAAKEVLEKNE